MKKNGDQVLDGHGSNGGDFAAKKTKTFMLRYSPSHPTSHIYAF